MWTSFAVPLSALLGAAVLGMVAALSASPAAPLSELQIGALAWSLVLGVFGVQGLVNSAMDGPRPRPGIVAPHSSAVLTVFIAVGCLLLIGVAALLGLAILSGQGVPVIGLSAAAGCLLLAGVLGAYKQRFLGNEVRVEARRDGIPW